MARIPTSQRRQDFVDAAVGVIAEHGVSGATTRRIADAANAPLATLHYCFETKDELFVALFKKQNEGMAARIEVDEGVGLEAAAVELLVSSAEWYMDNPQFARAQFDLWVWATRLQGDQKHVATEIVEWFIHGFADALGRASDPATDDPTLALPLAKFLISTLDGLVLEWCAYQDFGRFRSELDLAIEAIALLVRSRRISPAQPTGSPPAIEG